MEEEQCMYTLIGIKTYYHLVLGSIKTYHFNNVLSPSCSHLCKYLRRKGALHIPERNNKIHVGINRMSLHPVSSATEPSLFLQNILQQIC